MAPKKNEKGGKKAEEKKPETGDTTDEEVFDSLAGSSTDTFYRGVDLDGLIAKLDELNLEDKEAMEKTCTSEVKTLCLKLQAIQKSMKEEKASRAKAVRAERQKQIRDEKKEVARTSRETEVTVRVTIGDTV